MATRKDLLKAQGFISQRLIKALVNRAPDDVVAPLKRITQGTFASIMVGVLAVAAFGVVGYLHPGTNTSWQQDNTVIIDKDAGGVYIYVDNKLFPVYNITSALLYTGGGRVVTVSSASLARVPRENEVGIPRAPAQLPADADMKGYPIQLCSTPQAGTRVSTLQIDQATVPTPGHSPTFAMRAPDGSEYLVIDGTAYYAPKPAGDKQSPILAALGFSDEIEPGLQFVNALLDKSLTGKRQNALNAPTIANRGKPAQVRVGSVDTIGALLEVNDHGYYVLLADGLAPITPIEAAALEVSTNVRPTHVDAATIARYRSATTVRSPYLPDVVPTPSAPTGMSGEAICATWTADDRPPIIGFGGQPPSASPRKGNNGTAVDAVFMPPVTSALMQPTSTADTSRTSNLSLVTNSYRYGIADQAARDALGYSDTTPVLRVNANLLSLIPQGLDPGQILAVPNKQ